MEKKKTLWAKILVPVLIIAVIGGIWVVKTTSKQPTENISNEIFKLNETTEIDFKALSEYGLPVIADYGADSCIPCKQMAPVLKKFNEELQGKAFIKFVDVWQNANAAANVPVQVIPTQVIFNADGTPFVPSDELSSQIQFDMYTHRETGEHIFTVHQGGLTEEQMRAILAEMGVE